MKKAERLKSNKFIADELQVGSIRGTVAAKQAYTKMNNGHTFLDTYSNTAYSNGNYPKADLKKKEEI